VTGICYKAVTISSVIWLLQGITITMAIIELLTRNLMIGTVRLFYGVVMSALIGFGLDLGTVVFGQAVGKSKQEAMAETMCQAGRGITPHWYPLFFLITTLSFNMLLHSHFRQLVPMTITAAICYTCTYLLDPVLGTNPTSIIAAFTTGVCANLYSRYSGNPSILCVISGLILLVPGSVAVSGFFLFLQKDTSGGIGLAVSMLSVALSLAVGLFLSSLFVRHDETKDWFARLDRMQEESGKRSDLVF